MRIGSIIYNKWDHTKSLYLVIEVSESNVTIGTEHGYTWFKIDEAVLVSDILC